MARTPQDVTEAELAVLQVLWDGGPSTIRHITDALYPDSGASHYATVQKLLERLEKNKGFVQRDRSETIHVFSANVNRHDLIGRKLQSVAEQLCGGSWTPLLTTLVQQDKLSSQERKQLRELIDQLDQTSQPKRNRRS